MIKKKKIIFLFSGSLCLALGIVGLVKGFNSHEQWRQSAGIIGFILLLAIFIASIIAAFQKK